MHLEILVEEESAEAALALLVPRVLPGVSFAIHPHRGKPALLTALPGRMLGYSNWAERNEARIVVLVDRDAQDCHKLKQKLEEAARQAGLVTKSAAPAGAPFTVVNRLAIEELEAWFLGDVQALCAAFPGVPQSLGARRAFRDPDAVAGGTWEALRRELRRAGHQPGGKIEIARQVATHMDPARNTSASFRFFCETLRLAAAPWPGRRTRARSRLSGTPRPRAGPSRWPRGLER